MAVGESISEHPKKRRKRATLRKAVSGRLILDENARGEIGTVSADLLESLGVERETLNDRRDPGSRTFYAAVQPWAPLAPLVEDLPWTIVALQPGETHDGESSGLTTSTVSYPAGSPALGTFLKSLESLDPSRSLSQIQKPVEIRIQLVEPLFLETIFVTVQKNLIQSIDEVQARFGGGFSGNASNSSRKREPSRSVSHLNVNGIPQHDAGNVEERLQNAVRQGLSRPEVVHSGDLITLPLPSHPITHAPPPPAIVMACEPVNQGLMSSYTKIVLIEAQSSHERAVKKLQPPKPVMKQVAEDEAEDTSNEQFYSAAEERYSEAPSEIDGITEDESGVNSSDDDDGDESDDSLEDMISLSAPGLPPQPSGTLSAMTTETPRPGGRRANGTHTPGSVYSTYTSTTTRPGKALGRTLRAEVLLQRIPQEALFPRPAEDEDEESFVFVDINMLAKIGCFSGDWVKMGPTDPPNDYFSALNFGNLNGTHSEQSEWRAVRLFGIPGLATSRPKYAVDKSGDRRTSISQTTPLFTASVYMSPMLFNSLGESRHVKLSPLFPPSRLPKHLAQEAKSASGKLPPIATEVVLSKIQNPSSTERSLDQAVFSRLQKYFEYKRRLLKGGDLIGLNVDDDLARALFSPAKSVESTGDAEIFTALSQGLETRQTSSKIIWFGVSHVSLDRADQQDEEDDNPWGGVAVVDINSTTIRQAGTETRNISSHTINHWQYWHGTKHISSSSSNLKIVPLLNAQAPTYYVSPLQSRLRDLISAATSSRAINLGLPPLVILLHSHQRLTGKTYLATQACSAAGIHTFPISAFDVLAEGSSTSGGGDVKTEGYLTARAERAFQCGSQYTALLIQHMEQLTADRILPTLKEIISSSRIVIATTTDIEKIPDGIRGLFTHELEIKAPDESGREGILHNAVLDFSLRLSPAVSLRSVALKTAALVAGDLLDVVYRASLARSHRISDLIDTQNARKVPHNFVDLSSVVLSGGLFATHILPSDFDSAVTTARTAFSASISAPRIPSVTWSDVGGLASAKSSIMETISLPLTHPSLFAKGLRKRSGILFYGPPGTGKTLLAKAIATEFSLNFFSVKGPELLNMYIGESEANVRRVFQRARDARPCVVFFDELDSVAPKRGNQGDSGGVMDRIVSQLLAELDGMSSGSSSDGKGAEGTDSGSTGGGAGVFVIGATNRPDLLDPALLRPGRFDKLIYLGIPDTHDKQLHILQALTRKFALAPSVDLQRVSQRLPLTYTGADLYALASDAMLKAVTRRADETDIKVNQLNEERKSRGMEEISTAWYFDHVATDEDIKVLVNEDDFDSAAHELVGSVSEKELKHFEQIRTIFEQGDGQFSQSDTSQNPIPGRSMLPLRPAATPRGISNPFSPSQHFATPPASQRPSAIFQASLPTATSKGKGKNAIGNPDSEPDTPPSHVDSQEDSSIIPNGATNEDENGFVVNTSHLKSITKGKGKGKAVVDADDGEESTGGGFMSFDEKDEDLFALRRSALRALASSPSPSFAAQARSITRLSHSAFKASRQSTITVYQRRWASDESEKRDVPPIEKTEPTPEEQVENAVETGAESSHVSQGSKSAIDTAAAVVSEAAQDAVEAVKEAAQDVASSSTEQAPVADERKQTLYLGNLFFDVDEQDLQTEFQRFGEITNTKLIRDPRGLSKGFGYITFKSSEAAAEAKEAMNQTVYEGRRIVVQFAQRPPTLNRSATSLNPPSTTLFIGNMSFQMTDRDLNTLFKGIRNVIDVRVAIDRRTGQPRGFAHADFIDVKSAVEAQQILAGKETYGRRLRVDFSQSTRPPRESDGAAKPTEEGSSS